MIKFRERSGKIIFWKQKVRIFNNALFKSEYQTKCLVTAEVSLRKFIMLKYFEQKERKKLLLLERPEAEFAKPALYLTGY